MFVCVKIYLLVFLFFFLYFKRRHQRDYTRGLTTHHMLCCCDPAAQRTFAIRCDQVYDSAVVVAVVDDVDDIEAFV